MPGGLYKAVYKQGGQGGHRLGWREVVTAPISGGITYHSFSRSRCELCLSRRLGKSEQGHRVFCSGGHSPMYYVISMAILLLLLVNALLLKVRP